MNHAGDRPEARGGHSAARDLRRRVAPALHGVGGPGYAGFIKIGATHSFANDFCKEATTCWALIGSSCR